MCVSAAEALSPTIFDRFRDRFGLEIVDGIGSTEMLHIFCSNVPGAVVRGSTGRPVPGYELRIVDEDGGVLPGEAVGNLEVRGDSCAAFYWHQHEKTKASMRGDWFTTGDRYRRTDDGVYVYEGRADDMLKIGGLWVSPVDMENAIMEHPLVDGVGVVGVTVDEVSRVAAYIIRRDGDPTDDELADELRALCKQRLRRYEYPHVVRFVGDCRGRSTAKGPERFRLRELAGTEPQAATAIFAEASARKPSRQLGRPGCQPSSALALALEAPRDSVIIVTAAGLADEPRQPRRQVARRLGADGLRQVREPLADGGGLVVDDVVDLARAAALDRRQRARWRRRRRAGRTRRRSPSPTSGELALADHLDLLAAGRQPVPGP